MIRASHRRLHASKNSASSHPRHCKKPSTNPERSSFAEAQTRASVVGIHCLSPTTTDESASSESFRRQDRVRKTLNAMPQVTSLINYTHVAIQNSIVTTEQFIDIFYNIHHPIARHPRIMLSAGRKEGARSSLVRECGVWDESQHTTGGHLERGEVREKERNKAWVG